MPSAPGQRTTRARSLLISVLAALSTSCGSELTSGNCCADLPGGASPTLADLFGTVLYRSDGSQTGVPSLQGRSLVGIYFASRSCPACGAFTPQLVSVYDAWRKDGKSFEVVLASVDPASTDLFAYMTQHGMKWLAIPLGSPKIGELLRRYDVAWVPTLVVINSTGRTITRNGRDDVAVLGVAAFDGWLAASAKP